MAFSIEIKRSRGKGRGVYATKNFSPGETIEICPVIVISPQDYSLMEKTIFDTYMYDWYRGCSCIPTGYGLLYNHSYKPNAKYIFHKKDKTISYHAIKNINEGEEIFVNYNGVPTDNSPLEGFSF